MVRPTMPESFHVTGGARLAGTLHPAGNKNAALPMIAAALLGEGASEIHNVPRIRDVDVMLDLVRSLGAIATWQDEHVVVIDPAGLQPERPDPRLCGMLRASILLAGPLLARFGRVTLPPPGGDVIGRRRMDTHFVALERLGAEITIGADYQLEASHLHPADVFLDEPSVTATENALMAAALVPGTTLLRNAASEPHVQDLANALRAMGASIDGVGTNLLTVHGAASLAGTRMVVGPDHIEVGSFIGLAAVTGGDIEITGVRPDDLRSTLLQFARLGIRPRLDDDRLSVGPSQERRITSDLGGHVPKIEDGPWPAFPADLMSIATVVATQCEGVVLIFEKMFESRLFFVDRLIAMGARIVLCDPHRAVISGPAPLRGDIVASPDIRAGMGILLAALAAEGESVIHNIEQIDRGYERIDERLRSVGAQIERVSR